MTWRPQKTLSSEMKRIRGALVTTGLLVAGVAVLAQPLFSEGDLDDAMKGVGRQFELINRMVAASDFEEAKVRVTRAREQLSPTISFWRNHDRDDAVAMVRTATRRLDELDAALSELTIDPGTVASAVEAVGAACEACHGVYREQDPATDAFRLKPGLVR